MNRKLGLLLTIVLALTVSACGNKKDSGAVSDTTTTAPVSEDTSNQTLFNTGLTAQELRDLGIEGDPLNYKVLYFEYNSSAIDRRSTVIAKRHAQYLGANGGARVTLEGHADERGTRDYNLALGERRAQAVAEFMNSEGAQSTIQTISYGEERPADPAHTEAAWQQNRRVEIKY
ncbi:peptidoglycan-associated lipoprotein Pal [Arenicella xantha]|uniref:Peptidoglycan-associated lipoprotein n=1 Tax=Arenicella xantha TaxID=644221 RepID=A0A395JUK0_9GAMM|nr:peptidoglycan-associated lipoprotein Pal [Arenicella xantha]RBP53218.1 peptidoglycan-associated lipoprotein [Arenicella xantha]